MSTAQRLHHDNGGDCQSPSSIYSSPLRRATETHETREMSSKRVATLSYISQFVDGHGLEMVAGECGEEEVAFEGAPLSRLVASAKR